MHETTCIKLNEEGRVIFRFSTELCCLSIYLLFMDNNKRTWYFDIDEDEWYFTGPIVEKILQWLDHTFSTERKQSFSCHVLSRHS